MITPKDIEKTTMTLEKRKIAHNDFFAFCVGRPLSYVLTIPFLYTNLTPNTISVLSIVPLVIGLLLSYSVKTIKMQILCWVLFFFWNLLDGVDGNVARYKKQFSKMGNVYDAMSGYVAMVFTFLAMGMISAHSSSILIGYGLSGELLIVMGALSGMFMIFPRLVMHKAISTFMNSKKFDEVKDRSSFNLLKVIVLNLSSVAGGAQVLMLVAIVFQITDLYTVCYFLFNFLIMVASLKSILKERN